MTVEKYLTKNFEICLGGAPFLAPRSAPSPKISIRHCLWPHIFIAESFSTLEMWKFAKNHNTAPQPYLLSWCPIVPVHQCTGGLVPRGSSVPVTWGDKWNAQTGGTNETQEQGRRTKRTQTMSQCPIVLVSRFPRGQRNTQFLCTHPQTDRHTERCSYRGGAHLKLSKPQPNLNTRLGLTIKWLCITTETQCQHYLSCYLPDFDETLKVASWNHL